MSNVFDPTERVRAAMVNVGAQTEGEIAEATGLRRGQVKRARAVLRLSSALASPALAR